MERFRKSWQIKQARMNAMFGEMDETPKSADELQRAADKAERIITDRKGIASVVHFKKMSKKIPEILELISPTEKEDKESHVDLWVKLSKPVEGRTVLGVEIKSSNGEVRCVKDSTEFKKFYPFNLILNTNYKRREKDIIRDFRSELERVARNLRKARFNK